MKWSGQQKAEALQLLCDEYVKFAVRAYSVNDTECAEANVASASENGGGAAADGASGIAGGWGVVPENDQLTVEKVKDEFRAAFGHWTRYVLNMDWLEVFPGSVRDIENVDVLGELGTLDLQHRMCGSCHRLQHRDCFSHGCATDRLDSMSCLDPSLMVCASTNKVTNLGGACIMLDSRRFSVFVFVFCFCFLFLFLFLFFFFFFFLSHFLLHWSFSRSRGGGGENQRIAYNQLFSVSVLLFLKVL